jgi:prepilin-type N-terminal cleavage/methylation domain-containing protein
MSGCPRPVPVHLPAAARGMSLIELMVAMTIGLFLTWGAFEVYLQSKNNYRAAEVVTRLQENARFALETVEPDLRLAGFWGAELVAPASGISVTCDAADVSAWALQFAEAVAAVDDGYDLDCPPFSEAREGSDVLVVRHASADVRDPEAGKVQLQVDLALAEAFDGGVPPATFGPASQTRDVVFHAYYVDNDSSFAESIPSLRRLTLVGGTIENQEMISGVENLQVQFGLDTNGDGSVERYVDPDSAAITEGAAGFLPDARIVAVRIWMLVRSEESPGRAFRDDRQYVPPDADAVPIVPAGPLYPPEFQRLEVTKTVFLRNQAPRG